MVILTFKFDPISLGSSGKLLFKSGYDSKGCTILWPIHALGKDRTLSSTDHVSLMLHLGIFSL